jgi:hypothetical protein
MQPARATTLRCRRCGGAFELREIVETVHCPFCSEQQAVPEALRAELSRYERKVAGELERADQAHLHAAAWQELGEGRASDPRRNFIAAFGFLLGPPIAVSAVMVVGMQTGALTAAAGPWLALGTIGSTCAGAVGYGLWYVAGRSVRVRLAVAVGTVRVA